MYRIHVRNLTAQCYYTRYELRIHDIYFNLRIGWNCIV